MCTSETDLSLAHEEELAEGIILVPHNLSVDRLANVPSAASAITKATDWWAERCLHCRCFISPTSNVLCRPFPAIGIKGESSKPLIVLIIHSDLKQISKI